jgi:hypothetical protein
MCAKPQTSQLLPLLNSKQGCQGELVPVHLTEGPPDWEEDTMPQAQSGRLQLGPGTRKPYFPCAPQMCERCCERPWLSDVHDLKDSPPGLQRART